MKNIREDIENLKEIVENLENSEFNKNLLNIVEMILEKVEELQVNIETIDETVTLLNDDLSGVQDELFEELTLEELEEHEEEYCEVVCSNCNKTLYVEKEMLSGKEEIPCPYCNKNFNV